MAIKEIETEKNNSVLRQKAKKVKHINSKIKEIVLDMTETMKSNDIIAGLAAPQLGHSLQIIVIRFDYNKGYITLINPQITKNFRKKTVMEENCMSVPGISVLIERYHKIIIEALDIEGRPIRIKAKGILARIIQHEIDHLNGILITDYK
ncbi:MAG: peptide deformylase [Patescibacteria group bacterium]|nr:peptide deformylase [Patescibacteria group bacterium]